MTPEFRGGLYAVSPESLGVEHMLDDEMDPNRKRRVRMIPLELQRLFARLQLLDKGDISTEHLTTKGFKWDGADGRIQHDVQVFYLVVMVELNPSKELNRLLFDAIERSLVRTPGEKLIERLYGGKLANQVSCMMYSNVSYQPVLRFFA